MYSGPDPQDTTATTSRLLRGGSLYTLATVAQMSSGLLVLPIVTRVLDSSEFGALTIALVAVQIAGIVAGLGLAGSIGIQYFTEHRDSARILVTVSGAIALVLVVIADQVGLRLIDEVGGVPYQGALRIAIWSAVPLVLINGCQSFLQASERPKSYVAVAALSSLGAQGIGLLIVGFIDDSPAAFMGGVLVGYSLSAVAGVVAVRPGIPGRASVPSLRTALKIGLPIVPHSLAAYVLAAGDRFVVEHFEGLEAVAKYHVAYLVGTLGLVVIAAVNRAWGPMIYGSADSQRWRLLARTADDMNAVASLLVAGLAVAAPVALVVLAPSEYDVDDLAPVAAIVSITALTQVMYLSRVHILFFHHKTRILAVATPLAAGANILLNVALIPVLSLEGAAVATVLAFGVLALLVTRAAARLVAAPWDHRAVVRAWLTAAPFVVVSVLVPASGMWLVVRLVTGLAMAAWLASRVYRMTRGRSSIAPATDEHSA